MTYGRVAAGLAGGSKTGGNASMKADKLWVPPHAEREVSWPAGSRWSLQAQRVRPDFTQQQACAAVWQPESPERSGANKPPHAELKAGRRGAKRRFVSGLVDGRG